MKPGNLTKVIGPAIAEIASVTAASTVPVEVVIDRYKLRGELKDERGRVIRGTWWRVLHTEGPTVIRGALLEDRADADRIAQEWARELRSKPRTKPTPATPPHCDPITATDETDHRAAAHKLISKKFPRASVTMKPEDWHIDVAENTGAQLRSVIKTKAQKAAHKKARRNFRRRANARVALAIESELRAGWFAREYCFKTDKQRAKEISERLNITPPITDRIIKHHRDNLGLVSKRWNGPAPRS